MGNPTKEEIVLIKAKVFSRILTELASQIGFSITEFSPPEYLVSDDMAAAVLSLKVTHPGSQIGPSRSFSIVLSEKLVEDGDSWPDEMKKILNRVIVGLVDSVFVHYQGSIPGTESN